LEFELLVAARQVLRKRSAESRKNPNHETFPPSPVGFGDSARAQTRQEVAVIVTLGLGTTKFGLDLPDRVSQPTRSSRFENFRSGLLGCSKGREVPIRNQTPVNRTGLGPCPTRLMPSMAS
jgi:hypothetical protein